MSDNNSVSQRVRVALQRAMSRIKELEAKSREPIAVVGMACRFPGGASLESYWETLVSRKDMVREIPDQRAGGPWPEGVPRWAGLLDQIDEFDSSFFGISPREALTLDPQQRLLLEVAWEALEHAGVVPADLAGSKTGVFVGLYNSDYRTRASQRPPSERDAYETTGNMSSLGAGRIAYVLGLQGPAMVVDTVCSSSLVTVHLACQSLRNGESDLALAGGVNLILSHESTLAVSFTQALSPDGRCRTFDASANGFVRGEGCGLIVLKRLSDAQRDNDTILGLIRGSAVNHDGRSSGLTAPNMLAQESLLREALAHAELEPQQVGFIECHGTGTSLGDPIELEAIKSVFGKPREDGSKLWLGAVKTNLGHLESAAGIAGIIKILLAAQHESIPPNLHLRRLNPRIKLSGTPLSPVTEVVEWAPIDGRRVAGVSGFGMSGTNAHVILEGPPARAAQEHQRSATLPVPLLISGRSEAALRAQAANLRAHIDAHPELSPIDVAYSLATARTHFEHRACVVAEQLPAAVDNFAITGTARSNKLALLFTGQGAQRPSMGAALYQTFPGFRAALDEIFACFDAHLDPPLREVMFAAEGSELSKRLDQTAYTQPALFAIEVALFRLFSSWGIAPALLLGHSIGELVAAHVGGVMSLADACKLVAARGRLMQALPSGGAMLSIAASEAEVLSLLEHHSGADIAGLNGPLSTVVSGDEDAIAAIEQHFTALGRKCRRLIVSHAFHSRRMDPMLDDFRKVAQSITFGAPTIPIVSNVTGELATVEQLTSPEYWVRHVRQAVRFLDGVRTLEAQDIGLCLELGPHGVLTSMASACLSEAGQDKLVLLPALRRDRAEAEAIALALGGLHSHGINVDWRSYFADFNPERVSLPTYAFQRQRHWVEVGKPTADLAAAGLDASDHPILGAAVPLADSDAFVFTARLSLADHAWLADHVVFDHILFPGTGFLDLAITAGTHVGTPLLEELSIEAPLTLQRDEPVLIQLSLGAPDDAGRRSLAIHSRVSASSPWTRHAVGSMTAHAMTPSFDLHAWPPPCAGEASLDSLYEQLARAGLAYGPAFQGLVRAWTDGDIRFAEVQLPEGTRVDGFAIHPALLDAALHALGLDRESDSIALPFAWSGVCVHAAGATALRVRLRPAASEGSYIVEVADAAGQPLASIETLAIRPATANELRGAIAGARARDLYRLDWRPLPKPEPQRFASVVQIGERRFPLATSVPSLAAIEVAPELLLISPGEATASPLELCSQQLALLQRFFADDRFANTRLVVITRRAVATRDDEDVLELAHASLWGLVRAVQAEHRDRRLTLLDLDDTDVDLALALASDEPQLAVRDGQLLAPRLMPVRSVDAPHELTLAPRGSVLITGGTGALGALVAKHLVERHGVRHLVLCSRRGADSPGATELLAELESLGASVRIVAADIAELAQAQALLDSIPAEHPLTAIIHTAGLLDDGLLATMSPERLAKVFAPKVDAASNLHRLTRELPLRAFVIFSSIAGVLGSAAQANYAAANHFLDALCSHRRAQGLPAVSLAWGPWSDGGMAARLSQADIARMRRSGLTPISASEGLALFDAALTRPEPALVPVRLDSKALADADDLPRVFSALVRSASKRAAASTPTEPQVSQQLASLDAQQRRAFILELVCREVAAVLGLADSSAVAPDRPFQELGLDSLMAVELRNRLQQRLGLRLSPSLVFDRPTTHELADALFEQLAPTDSEPAAAEPKDSAFRMISLLHTSSSKPVAARAEPWFAALLNMALARGHYSTVTSLLDSLAQARHDLHAPLPEANPINIGGSRNPAVQFYCVPSIAAPSTHLQFMRLGAHLARVGSVWTADNAGYSPGQRLVEDRETFIAHHLAAIAKCRSQQPLLIVGYSAGGWLATELVRALEQSGAPASALILLDSTIPPEQARILDGLLSYTQRNIDNFISGTSVHSEEELIFQLTSMHKAFYAWGGWTPPRVAPPALYVKAKLDSHLALGAESSTISTSPETEWAPHIPSLTIEIIDCDHFDMIATEASTTAQIILDWVSRTAQ